MLCGKTLCWSRTHHRVGEHVLLGGTCDPHQDRDTPEGPPYFSDILRLSLPQRHVVLHRQDHHEKTASSIFLLQILLINDTFPKPSQGPVLHGNSDSSPAHERMLISGNFGAVIAKHNPLAGFLQHRRFSLEAARELAELMPQLAAQEERGLPGCQGVNAEKSRAPRRAVVPFHWLLLEGKISLFHIQK